MDLTHDLSKMWHDFDKYGSYWGKPITGWTIFRELELKMPAKKDVRNGSTGNVNGNGGGSKGSNDGWKWVNVTLSDDDARLLTKSDATLEYLSACGAELADRGYGFKVESTDQGKSVRCVVYRPDFPVRGRIIGVSAYAGNARDAILACLYKLDTYLGGDFSTVGDDDLPETQRPRFR
jgi:hypothetical protein